MPEAFHIAVNGLRLFALLFGSGVIFVGIARAASEARGPGGRVRAARRIGVHAALGLEFFVGATILNLVINPTWTVVASTSLTIVVRKLVVFSLGRSAREA